MSESVRIASFQRRLLAKGLDLFLVLVVGVFTPYGVGSVLGFFYSIFSDALSFKKIQHQSVGKYLFKIRAVESKLHRPVSLKESAIRNAPVGIITFFAIFPFWGWILAVLLGIPLFLVELVLMIRANKRQRLGDAMADTIVIRT